MTNVLSEKKFSLKILGLYTNITLRIMNSLYKFFKGMKMGSSSEEVIFSSFQHLAEPISSQSWKVLSTELDALSMEFCHW